MTGVADAIKRIEAKVALMEEENRSLVATNLELRERLEKLTRELGEQVATLQVQMETVLGTVPLWPIERTEERGPEVIQEVTMPPPPVTGGGAPQPAPGSTFYITGLNYRRREGKYHCVRDCRGMRAAITVQDITGAELRSSHSAVGPCSFCARDAGD